MSCFLAAGSVAAAAASASISSPPTAARGTTNKLRCMPRTTVQHDTNWPLWGTLPKRKTTPGSIISKTSSTAATAHQYQKTILNIAV